VQSIADATKLSSTVLVVPNQVPASARAPVPVPSPAAAADCDRAPAEASRSLTSRLGGWFVETFVPGGEDTARVVGAWIKRNGYWLVLSGQIHLILFLILGIVAVYMPVRQPPPVEDAPAFDAATVDTSPDDPGLFRLADVPLDPTELTTATLLQLEPVAQTAKYYDDAEQFEEAGGGANRQGSGEELLGHIGFSLKHATGPGGRGGTGVLPGLGGGYGEGGTENGFGGRGAGHREALAGAFGGTKASERAVAAALNWLYRHQNQNGTWSLNHTRRCRGARCSGPGNVQAEAAATALGLLPYLAAGQTHRSQGPYQQTINRAVVWLLRQQKPDGNLAGSAPQPMYSHALATIALCEAYGLSGDENLRSAAQKAVRFIEEAQNRTTGGWRYHPGDTGDTSVVGWQIMALQSAMMAGLPVEPAVVNKSKDWLQSVAQGDYGGLYAYLPHREATPATTAIGLLCRQYLGTRSDDPAMQEGRDYLLRNLPDDDADRNTYYWYYGTLVLHNLLGPEWDTWNRRLRRVLIESQEKAGCALGSWDPEQPSVDAWGAPGGRHLTTCLATLSLEVYYRYLPLFQSQSPPRAAARGTAGAPVR
jgi:hypothetical protein